MLISIQSKGQFNRSEEVLELFFSISNRVIRNALFLPEQRLVVPISPQQIEPRYKGFIGRQVCKVEFLGLLLRFLKRPKALGVIQFLFVQSQSLLIENEVFNPSASEELVPASIGWWYFIIIIQRIVASNREKSVRVQREGPLECSLS